MDADAPTVNGAPLRIGGRMPSIIPEVELAVKPTIAPAVYTITIRPGPYSSATAGPSWRTQYMLKKMCRRFACSHAAESTVHQRWRPNTGSEPLAPNCSSVQVFTPRKLRPMLVLMLPTDNTRLATYATVEMTAARGTKPQILPHL